MPVAFVSPENAPGSAHGDFSDAGGSGDALNGVDGSIGFEGAEGFCRSSKLIRGNARVSPGGVVGGGSSAADRLGSSKLILGNARVSPLVVEGSFFEAGALDDGVDGSDIFCRSSKLMRGNALVSPLVVDGSSFDDGALKMSLLCD